MPISLRLDHVGVRRAARRLLLRRDGGLDLDDLVRDQRVRPVAPGVVRREDVRRLLNAVDADEPPGALGRQQEPRERHEGEHDLQQHGDAPAPVRGDVAARKGDPAAQRAAKVPPDHEERVGDGALLGVGDLVDQQGCRVAQPRGGDADEEARVGECLLVLRCPLHHHAQHEEEIADIDAQLAPVVVGHPCRHGEGDAVAEPVYACDPA